MSKRKKKKKSNAGLIIVILLQLILIGGVYAYGLNYSGQKFFPGTTIDGLDVSKMTAEEAEAELQKTVPSIRIVEMDPSGKNPIIEEISLDKIGYKASYDTQSLLSGQKHIDWFIQYRNPASFSIIKTGFTYDSSLLEQVTDSLIYVRNISGRQLSRDEVRDLFKQAVEEELDTILLFRNGYLRNDPSESDEDLLEEARAVEGVYLKSLTVHMYDEVTEILWPSDLKDMIYIDDEMHFTANEAAVDAFVDKLSKKYTVVLGHRRSLVSGSGKTVYVGTEDDVFDYTFDAALTKEAIMEGLFSPEDITVPAGWIRKERYVSPDQEEELEIHSEPSIPGLTVNEFGVGTPAGGTYIEISLDDQHLWYFENGELIVEGDVVTGYQDVHDTPCAVFQVENKDEDYNKLEGGSVCDYWVGFYGQTYGIHDAYRWRTKYGGDIYQWNGSHGCVNAPLEVAQTLYERVEMGTPVIVYESSRKR
ncbi:MAG: L,D-transpeptidase [Firmicutes bacterium]|nr:L,D-transpeptidase [Bacillota bacterium]